MNKKITREMIEASYRAGKDVYRNRKQMEDAVNELSINSGMNIISGRDFIFMYL